jgi:organic radical activating enzyme
MSLYRVNEIFTSIQGEGIDTGQLSTFIRLAGCNLACSFCDTNFSLFQIMNEEQIADRINPMSAVVITGGEPLLQDVKTLTTRLWEKYCIVTIETNGTQPASWNSFDKISLSPKVPFSECMVKEADSLKILFPYVNDITAENYAAFHAKHKTLQVIDPDKKPENIKAAIEELKNLSMEWRLGIQIHKFIGAR